MTTGSTFTGVTAALKYYGAEVRAMKSVVGGAGAGIRR